jgi:hypothetical protein
MPGGHAKWVPRRLAPPVWNQWQWPLGSRQRSAPQPSATLTIAGSAPTTGAGGIAALAAEARPKAKAALKTSALTMFSSLSTFVAMRVH